MNNRIEKENRLKELNDLLTSPDIMKNQKEYARLSKEYKKIEQLLAKYDERDRLEKEINGLAEMMQGNDPEIKEMAETELPLLQKKLSSVQLEIAILSNPKLAEYDKNCIVEIRAGAGGNEASLFAADLYRMYSKYCERQGLRLEALSSHPSDIGGFKEIIFAVEGPNAYRHFHFEKGVHRVQRIPVTEAGGRIHTSTVTVAVLPEIEETQFSINPNDLKIDTFRAGGHGGQNVNKVSSAVRLTHLPSGMVVVCQDERSQHKNRERAMKILRARLAAIEEEKKQNEIDSQRRKQVGTGERSEKIRTYNYPQNRVTDHRIGLSLYNLDHIIEGEINELIEKLEEYETAGAKDL